MVHSFAPKKNLQLIYPTRNTVGTHNKIWSHNQAKSVCNLRLNNTYLSSVSNDSITYTHPDRKLGILCMKYFAGVGGVNGLLNEASLPEFIMKISEERQNYCILTCRPSRDIYKHACAHTHARTHTHTHTYRNDDTTGQRQANVSGVGIQARIKLIGICCDVKYFNLLEKRPSFVPARLLCRPNLQMLKVYTRSDAHGGPEWTAVIMPANTRISKQINILCMCVK